MFTPAKKKGPRTAKQVSAGKLRLHVGDLVRVISGKDKGKEGKITKVMPSDGKVVIEGLNIMIKHQKPRQQNRQNAVSATAAQSQGGRLELSAPLNASNVQLVDPGDNKSLTRIGVSRDSNGDLVRVARKSGSVIENG